MSCSALRTSVVRALFAPQQIPRIHHWQFLRTNNGLAPTTTTLLAPPFPWAWSVSRVNSSASQARRQYPIERRHRRDTAQERNDQSFSYHNRNRTSTTGTTTAWQRGGRTKERPKRTVRASFVASNQRSSTSGGREWNTRTPKPAVTATIDAPRIKHRWTNVEGSRYQRRQLAAVQQQKDDRGPTSNDKAVKRSYDSRNDSPSDVARHRRSSVNSGTIYENDRMGSRYSTERRQRSGTSEDTTDTSRQSGQHLNETSRRPKEYETTPPRYSKRLDPASDTKNPAAVHRGHDEVARRRSDSQKPQQNIVRPTWFPPDRLEAYVACHPGLESILCQELQSLGLSHRKKGFGATLPSPSMEDLLRCHLFLGTASHVFLRCGAEFSARALGELERKVEKMPWSQILPPSYATSAPRFQIKVSSAKSRLLHSTAIRDHVLVGIYKSLGFEDFDERKKENNRVVQQVSTPNSEGIVHDAIERENELRLTVQFYRDKAQISIDTSSKPLHQRNYRLETAKAPLREDIAFAFLHGAGWKPSYRSHEEESLLIETGSVPFKAGRFTSYLDPFCGSGTLPIEAAAMAAGLPPGRLRPAPFHGTCLYDPEQWDRLLTNAIEQSAANTDASHRIQIRASDRDMGAVKATKANAERAGVSSLIQAEQCAFTAHPWLDQPSPAMGRLLIGSNLPFGRRLSAGVVPKNYLKHPLLPMYQSLANHLNRMKATNCHFDAMLLTDDKELLRLGGFCNPFHTALSTKHGGIPVAGMLMGSTEFVEKDIAVSTNYNTGDANMGDGNSATTETVTGPNDMNAAYLKSTVSAAPKSIAYANAYYHHNVPR